MTVTGRPGGAGVGWPMDTGVPGRLLQVEHLREGGDAVIAARGEIDITTAPLLSDALRAAVEGDAARVTVDLCEVSFMDSNGLHLLLNALRRMTRQGRRLSIACHKDGGVHRLLSLADLVGTFSVHPSRHHALSDADALRPDRWRR